MIEINCLSLSKNIDVLSSLIDEYQEISLNLFNSLDNSTIDWIDSYSLQFERAILLDKTETKLFIQSLTERKEVLKFIYDKYVNFGNVIKFNCDKKKALLNLFESISIDINSVLSDFDNNCNGNFKTYDYGRELRRINTNINFISKSIISTFNNLEKIENLVNKKINELEEIKINDFDFTGSNYE